MASFKSTIITQKGHNLMAKLSAGTATMSFTKIKSSDHDYSALTSSQLEALVSIDNIKQEVLVNEVTRINDASVKVSGSILNTSLTTGYYIKTIALYANDPDEGEILYSITVANESDWMPPYNNVSSASILIDLITVVSNAENVTIDVDPNAIVTITQFNEFKDKVNTHLSDMVYQTAGGSATAMTLTIKGTLVNGYPITFIASANNGGAATTINGKKLYKPNTTTAPNLISGKAYTVWYNSTNDCFFIKASAEGTALASDVRKNKTFSNDNDTGIVGGLDLSLLVSGNLRAGVTIDGVTGKSSVVDTADSLATAAQLLSGTSAYVNGTKLVGNMPNHTGADSPANSIAGTGPSRIYVRPQYGYYDGNVASYVDDGNFIATNIVAGKSIFGLAGAATIESLGGKRYATGTAIPQKHSDFIATIDLSALPFIPSVISTTGTAKVYDSRGGLIFVTAGTLYQSNVGVYLSCAKGMIGIISPSRITFNLSAIQVFNNISAESVDNGGLITWYAWE